jgi:hypothetical protein
VHPVLFEIFLGALLTVFIVTQFIVPITRGTRILPVLRSDRRFLESEQVDAKDKAELEAMLQNLTKDTE